MLWRTWILLYFFKEYWFYFCFSGNSLSWIKLQMLSLGTVSSNLSSVLLSSAGLLPVCPELAWLEGQPEIWAETRYRIWCFSLWRSPFQYSPLTFPVAMVAPYSLLLQAERLWVFYWSFIIIIITIIMLKFTWHKINDFKVNSVHFSTFIMLDSHHFYLVSKDFHQPEREWWKRPICNPYLRIYLFQIFHVNGTVPYVTFHGAWRFWSSSML